MAELKFVVGDATKPIGDDNKIIMHICNDVGGWGKGFVVPLGKKWPQTKLRYLELEKYAEGYQLGITQIIPVETSPQEIIVANMVAQHGIYGSHNKIDYNALAACLRGVGRACKTFNASIHAPRIGAGLAGAPWSDIEDAIKTILISDGINVTIYDLPEEANKWKR